MRGRGCGLTETLPQVTMDGYLGLLPRRDACLLQGYMEVLRVLRNSSRRGSHIHRTMALRGIDEILTQHHEKTLGMRPLIARHIFVGYNTFLTMLWRARRDVQVNENRARGGGPGPVVSPSLDGPNHRTGVLNGRRALAVSDTGEGGDA